MKLLTTTDGIGRIDGETVALIETRHSTLDAALRAGEFDELRTAPIRRSAQLGDLTVLPPIVDPGQFVIIGLNYRPHADETSLPIPDEVLFAAIPGAGVVTAPGGDIVLPEDRPDQVDYEGEIAVVIGKRAHDVAADEAWSYVAGVTGCNDVSARDMQMEALMANDEGPSQGDAKGFPTFKPLGPVLLTVDNPDDFDVTVRTWVNGEQRQEGHLAELVFGVPEIIAQVTRQITLEPGDVICTGSPSGVGFTSGSYLRPGDLVEIGLDDLPVLRNVVRAGRTNKGES